MTEGAPEEWSLTPLSRSLVDFEHMLDSTSMAPFFRSVETISGLFDEQKRLTKITRWLYFGTFLGAVLILSGPLPENIEVSAVGAKVAVSVVPQQLVSLATAVAYGLFSTHLISLIVLSQMIQRILQREGPESWQFFAARFDATVIWATPLMPKTVGYSSPKRHIAIAILAVIVPLMSMLAHSIAVLFAISASTISAFQENQFLLKAAAVSASIIAATGLISVVVTLLVRMPFRWPKAEDKTAG